MTNEANITQSDFTAFLASGAFVRDRQHCWLLVGPFCPAEGAKKQGVSISCPAFYETEQGVFLSPTRDYRVTSDELSRLCLRYIEEAGEKAPEYRWEEPSRADFEGAFARVQNLISQGQIDKAVPVVFARSQGEVGAVRRARWVLEALTAPEALWPYGFWDGDEGILGVTPETLFRLEGRHLSTMALAGTLAKSDGSGEDLRRSVKDQHEHRLVVEDIRTQLGVFGRVQTGAMGLLELPKLWHLQTRISVELDEAGDVDVLTQRLHPTPALGVYPKQFGWRWMQELPGQQGRSRYGAPFTIRFDERHVLSLVAIRNVQWKGDSLVLGSGCGVVKDSRLESEVNELVRKRQSVMHALGMSK